MSIFGLLGIALLVALLIIVLGILITLISDADPGEYGVIIFVVALIVAILTIVTGMAICTDLENDYIAKYEAQKNTIEQALKSDVIDDLERFEIVNKAAELNGELAEKKAKHDRWHHVCYGKKSMYDNVKFIDFGG